MKTQKNLLPVILLVIISLVNATFAVNPTVILKATPSECNPGDTVVFTIIKKNFDGKNPQLLFDGNNVGKWEDGHKWVATSGIHVLRAYFKFGTPQETRNKLAIVNVSGWDTKEYNHPGLMSSNDEILRVKRNILKENHPMKQAWPKFSKTCNLDYKPQARIQVNMDKPEEKLPYDQDCNAVNRFAVYWAATGDSLYGAKAVEILNDWASKNITLADTAGSVYQFLHATNTMHKWLFAAEVLKYLDGGFNGWQKGDVNKFDKYVRDVFVPMTLPWLGSYGGQNQPLFVALSRMVCGIYLDDEILFNMGYDHMFTEKIKNHKWQSVAGGYEKISLFELTIAPGGEFIEVNRDKGHYLMDFGATQTMAEVLWHQGIDMWGMKLRGESTPRMHQGMEWAYKSVNAGQSYASFIDITWTVTKPTGRAKFETAYNHYKWRLEEKYPVPELEKFTLDFRGERGDANIVTHADLDKGLSVGVLSKKLASQAFKSLLSINMNNAKMLYININGNFNSASVKLYSLTGRLIKDISVKQNAKTISLKNLNHGLFIAKLTVDGTSKIRKLILK